MSDDLAATLLSLGFVAIVSALVSAAFAALLDLPWWIVPVSAFGSVVVFVVVAVGYLRGSR